MEEDVIIRWMLCVFDVHVGTVGHYACPVLTGTVLRWLCQAVLTVCRALDARSTTLLTQGNASGSPTFRSFERATLLVKPHTGFRAHLMKKWRHRFRVPLPINEMPLLICTDADLHAKKEEITGCHPCPLDFKILFALSVLSAVLSVRIWQNVVSRLPSNIHKTSRRPSECLP